MSKSYLRSLLVLTLLLVLIVAALPALASSATPQRAVPSWHQLPLTFNPPPRVDHALAYDTARGVAVMFGGYDDASYTVFNDTWEWDSQTRTWTERQPAHRPPARGGHTLIYDEAHGVTVLFGGVNTIAQEFGDTWIWAGQDWVEVSPVNSPSPRWLHGMAYDRQRQVGVLFGGLVTGIGASNDTWEWTNGSEWIEQPISGPAARYGGGLAYDTQRGVTVLFGGDEGIGWGTYFNDTWERTGGGEWVEVLPLRRPPVRQRMVMAYYPQFRRVVLFGGLGSFGLLPDTWAYGGLNWGTRTFASNPDVLDLGMVYDPILKGLLLFGGSGETWLFR